MRRHILIVEDNRDISELLALHLRDLNYTIDFAYDGEAGLERATTEHYNLIVLDLMLPGLDGIELCQQVRQQDNYVPILMLTAKSSELDRVLGLEMGADDYLTKPFSIREFLARVKAIFRRVEVLRHRHDKPQVGIMQLDRLSIDTEKRKVTLEDDCIDLTAKEFDLLLQFAQHPGRVFTRTQLLDLIWGYGHDGYEHTVNSHINRLRAKIETNPAKPEFILTVWGVGYKFFEPSHAESARHV